ncbi:MAG: dual specificity protein phosphatase family protein [Candidatus Binataceae bacterium]
MSEICPQLLIGEYPRPEDAAWLKQEYHITAVQNLQDNADLKINGIDVRALEDAYHKSGIRFARTPIPDSGADAMSAHLKEALEQLKILIDDHQRVLLHCNGGLNRAPTLAIAFMRAYCGMSLDEAMAHVKRRRACGPYLTILEDYFGPRDYKPRS